MKIRAELTFPGNLKDEPIICNLCKDFDIILSILEASFSTEVGWAILIMEGVPEEINKAKSYLEKKGVTLGDVKTVN